jgi:hypothetical protein
MVRRSIYEMRMVGLLTPCFHLTISVPVGGPQFAYGCGPLNFEGFDYDTYRQAILGTNN